MFLLKKNKIIKIKISGITTFGLFSNMENGFKGLIHISEISEYYVSDLDKTFKINDQLYARILSYDLKEKKVLLSIKGIKQSMPVFASDYSHTIVYDTYGGFNVVYEAMLEKLKKYEVK